MSKHFFKILIGAASVLSYMAAEAQDWKQKFASADAVYTNLSCEVTLFNKKGKLSASTKMQEDIYLATDKAAKLMSQGRIYHGSFNALKNWKAYSWTAENKKFNVSNVTTASSRQDYIFYDDAKITSFDFTGVGLGTTRHLEYELNLEDVHLLTPYYLDRYFPVANSELKIVFPNNVKVKYLLKGLNKEKVVFSENKGRDKTTYSFRINDAQSPASFSNAPDNSYYDTHIIFYIEQVEQDGQWVNYLSNTEDLYRYNYDYIKRLNNEPGADLKHITDSLTKGLTTEKEKTKQIYKWVQDHIKYVAFEDGLEGFIPRDANLVCSRRFGDCKDMASILTAMLNYAKVNAYFTWIGTRSLPYKYSESPLPIVDNHMICTANIDGEFIFLDGTDSDCIFGMPSPHIQGKEALIAVNDKEFKVAEVPVVPAEQNKYVDSTLLEMTDKGLSGKVKVYMTGYLSSDIHGLLNYRNESEREDYFKARFARGSNKIKFGKWKVDQAADRKQTWIESEFSLPDYAKNVGSEYLINLNLFKWFENSVIDIDKRKIAVESQYMINRQYITVLKIPAGYKVVSLPKNAAFKNEVWGYKIDYKQQGDQIIMSQDFESEPLLLQPEQFEKWNTVIKTLLPQYKQTIVLSKN